MVSVRGVRNVGSTFALLGVVSALGGGACDDGEDRGPWPAGGAGAGANAAGAGRGGSDAGDSGSGGTGDSGGAPSGGAGTDQGGSSGEGGSNVSGGDAGTGGTEGGTGGSTTGGVGGATGGSAGTGVTLPPYSCEEPSGELPPLQLTAVATVDDPVQIVAPPGSPRLFVVSRGGKIVILDEGAVIPEPFLTVGVDLHYSELGLLGLAFHPDYSENRLFYIHRILPRVGDQDTGDLVIEEYERDPNDVNRSLPTPRRELLRIPQPSHKHKGGTLLFDADKRLYIAIGNGGEQPASGDHSQLRGKVLRIDPNPDGDGYLIPEDNPQLSGWAPEILETGLRNPWRIALDPCTDDLYIGDVGNATFEEIDVSPAEARGRHYGFPVYEGLERNCKSCEDVEQVAPTAGYSHADGCAIIGGVVYRGHAIEALRGAYLYADLCEGLFRTFRYVDGEATDERDLTSDINPDRIENITSFGTDSTGEIYVLSRNPARVYRLEPE
jgi:glucose/arabinose dehydrogenase